MNHIFECGCKFSFVENTQDSVRENIDLAIWEKCLLHSEAEELLRGLKDAQRAICSEYCGVSIHHRECENAIKLILKVEGSRP